LCPKSACPYATWHIPRPPRADWNDPIGPSVLVRAPTRPRGNISADRRAYTRSRAACARRRRFPEA
jgi:hypothetical protein